MCPCLFLVGQHHQFKILAEKWDSVEARIFFGFELLAVPWRKVGDWWRMLGAPSGETAMEISHGGFMYYGLHAKMVMMMMHVKKLF
jgi:hypothetical protein